MVSLKDAVGDLSSFEYNGIRRVKAHLADLAIEGCQHSRIRLILLERIRVAARAALNEVAVQMLPLLDFLDEPLGPGLNALSHPGRND
jgi:hypothetical protein